MLEPSFALLAEIEAIAARMKRTAASYDPASQDDGEDHTDEVNGNNPDYLALKDGEQWYDEHNDEYRYV